ncbi:MAG: glycosyltransferase family 2 protein [Chitinophagales bacterium]|nr:glycosyltransferase family 2 protein [Chitinophagales bacterium]MDW8418251.1 glycosyltransferase family 2 protein [Chitinophagales bacterium]
MHKLSVAIITLNEEAHIEQCIRSVLRVADEVVVLDSFSTDNTAALATALGARVFQEPFAGFTEQKNKAASLCSYPYILSIDADEQLSDELQESILHEKGLGFPAQVYAMNRLNFYQGRPVKTCGWYPDTKVRLWYKPCAHWEGGLVHEKLQINHAAKPKILHGDLWHYTYANKEEMAQKVERFARLAAEQLTHKPAILLRLKMCISPAVRFFRMYFLRGGFITGKNGWEICYYHTREVYLRYRYALELQNNVRH